MLHQPFNSSSSRSMSLALCQREMSFLLSRKHPFSISCFVICLFCPFLCCIIIPRHIYIYVYMYIYIYSDSDISSPPSMHHTSHWKAAVYIACTVQHRATAQRRYAINIHNTCSLHKPIHSASIIYDLPRSPSRTLIYTQFTASGPPRIILSDELSVQMFACFRLQETKLTVILHSGEDEIKQICLSKLFIKEAYPRYNPNMLSRAGEGGVITAVRAALKSRCTRS